MASSLCKGPPDGVGFPGHCRCRSLISKKLLVVYIHDSTNGLEYDCGYLCGADDFPGLRESSEFGHK